MAKAKAPKTPKTLSTGAGPNSRATVAGPAKSDASENAPDDLTVKMLGTEALAAEFPFNTSKPFEYGQDAKDGPPAGQSAKPGDPIVGSSTVQERTWSDKVGSGSPVIGSNKDPEKLPHHAGLRRSYVPLR